MRVSDIGLVIATLGALFLYEGRNRTDLTVASARADEPKMITCPLRQPDFATVMQAAFLGDGTLIVEQQTRTRVRHIKDC
ncbi:hypothetical protein [Ancylobacter lacus]|uniref:hypothetical protein n=1 Tax=Ancylobacter lacus TaxID=2579970 RepID=UPI001BCB2444|nr:hypothetical protein [Ancylobacter lacus]MBS7541108.1 hypothetical protein [Ancylobacter lacus]